MEAFVRIRYGGLPELSSVVSAWRGMWRYHRIELVRAKNSRSVWTWRHENGTGMKIWRFLGSSPVGVLSNRYLVNLCVCLHIRLSPIPHPPSQPLDLGDGRIDGRMHEKIPFVFYKTSTPSELLLWLLHICHCNIDGQGKGTAYHVLPLSDCFGTFRFFLNLR